MSTSSDDDVPLTQLRDTRAAPRRRTTTWPNNYPNARATFEKTLQNRMKAAAEAAAQFARERKEKRANAGVIPPHLQWTGDPQELRSPYKADFDRHTQHFGRDLTTEGHRRFIVTDYEDYNALRAIDRPDNYYHYTEDEEFNDNNLFLGNI